MRTIYLAISFCLVSAPLIVVGRSDAQTATHKVLSDTAQYQVYSEVIANFFGNASGRKASDPIFISDHTPVQLGQAKSAVQKSIIDRWLIERFNQSLEEETLRDYEKNGAAEIFFGTRFSPELHVVLLSDTELAGVVKQSSGGLPPSYSQGIITLSRIGFNPQRTQSLVSLEYFCGVFCSTDEMFLLAKSGAGWKVQYAIPIAEAQ